MLNKVFSNLLSPLRAFLRYAHQVSQSGLKDCSATPYFEKFHNFDSVPTYNF